MLALSKEKHGINFVRYLKHHLDLKLPKAKMSNTSNILHPTNPKMITTKHSNAYHKSSAERML
jgi:hypothetical protein